MQHGTIDQWLQSVTQPGLPTNDHSYDLGSASAAYMRRLGYSNVNLVSHAGRNHETVWWSPRLLIGWSLFLDQTLPRARTLRKSPDEPSWLSSLAG